MQLLPALLRLRAAEQLGVQQARALLVPKGVHDVCQNLDFRVADISQEWVEQVRSNHTLFPCGSWEVSVSKSTDTVLCPRSIQQEG